MEGRRSKRGEKASEGVSSGGARRNVNPGKRERKRQRKRHREKPKGDKVPCRQLAQNSGLSVKNCTFVDNNVSKTFRVLYGNTRCVLNKIDELSALVYEQKPEFVMIAEAWSNENLNDAYFRIPAYELLCRKDRNDTTDGKGGGLLIYAKMDIVGSVVEVNIPEFDSFNQCCAIKMCLNDNSHIVFALVYRPHHIYKDTIPQPEFTAENNKMLCAILKKIPRPCVIVGDFNYSQIDWGVMSYDSSSEEFVMAVQDNFLSQHIDFSTHSSGTQPDLILSSCPDRILDVENLSKLGNSDHPMIMLTV